MRIKAFNLPPLNLQTSKTAAFIMILLFHIFCPQSLKEKNLDLFSVWLACLFLSAPIRESIFFASLSALFLETYYSLPFTFFITKIIGLSVVAQIFKANLSTEKSRTWLLFTVTTSIFYLVHLLFYIGWSYLGWHTVFYSVLMFFVLLILCSSLFHTNLVARQKVGVYY